ncbi:hypothetical protein A1355_18480 [Methylomonas koyamae]|uniref:Uncharacterized protein n=2 Tax=Methylococcaceae TaxID=403 RepID=A0A177P9A6_9GAMM|nr:hypothetical protein A1355_18480 [Methylomonas koyamae]
MGMLTSTSLPAALKREFEDLKSAGFGGIRPPEQTDWGWCLRLKELILPDGTRTDALVLLPKNYPLSSPIGFYLKENAILGTLDRSHLFEGRAYHGAQVIPGWRWFCGIAEGWRPGRHSLLSYVNVVMTLFNEVENQ